MGKELDINKVCHTALCLKLGGANYVHSRPQGGIPMGEAA